MLLLPAPAAAQRAVAVIDATSGDDADVTLVVGALSEQLDREAKDLLVQVPGERRAALMGALPEEGLADLSEARDALTRARDALTQFDEPKAITIVDTALAEAADAHPRSALMKVAADLAFTRGLAKIARNVGEAERDFAIVHRLDPGRTLSAVQYQPEVIEAFQRAGKAGKSTTLDVDGPAGASVWVDGVELGPAPATGSFSVGLHLVAVTGERLLASGQIVDVPGSGAQVTLTAAEAPYSTIALRLRARLLAADDGLARDEIVTALVRLAGAQDAFLVGRKDGEVVVWTYSGRTQAVGGEAHSTDGVPVEEIVKLLRPIRPPPPCPDGQRRVDGVCVDDEPFVPPPITPTTPWYRKRWVQATIGGTLLAGVVTTIVAVVTRDPGESFPIDEDPEMGLDPVVFRQ